MNPVGPPASRANSSRASRAVPVLPGGLEELAAERTGAVVALGLTVARRSLRDSGSGSGLGSRSGSGSGGGGGWCRQFPRARPAAARRRRRGGGAGGMTAEGHHLPDGTGDGAGDRHRDHDHGHRPTEVHAMADLRPPQVGARRRRCRAAPAAGRRSADGRRYSAGGRTGGVLSNGRVLRPSRPMAHCGGAIARNTALADASPAELAAGGGGAQRGQGAPTGRSAPVGVLRVTGQQSVEVPFVVGGTPGRRLLAVWHVIVWNAVPAQSVTPARDVTPPRDSSASSFRRPRWAATRTLPADRPSISAITSVSRPATTRSMMTSAC